MRGASTLVHGRTRYLLAGGFVAGFALIAAVMYLALGSRHSLERKAGTVAASAAPAPSSPTDKGGAAKSMDAEVARLVEAGAQLVEVRQDPGQFDNPDTWTVMRDPEGNEFCVTSTLTLTGVA